MTYKLTRHETPKTTMLRTSSATGVADGRCWCVPQRAMNLFYFGIAALTAVTVFGVLVRVENLLQSHIFAVCIVPVVTSFKRESWKTPNRTRRTGVITVKRFTPKRLTLEGNPI